MTDTLYNSIRDQINRYEAKGVDRDNMVLIMQPEHKEELYEMIDLNMTGTDSFQGVSIYCTARVSYSEPKVVNIKTIQDIVRDQIEGMSL